MSTGRLLKKKVVMKPEQQELNRSWRKLFLPEGTVL